MKRLNHILPAGDLQPELEFGPQRFGPARAENRCAGCSLRRGRKTAPSDQPLDRPCVTMMMAIIAGEPLL